MSKRKHHFVPRFYLKAFASAPKRIHLYNLRRGRAIDNASLADQCYQHRFYGPTEDLENALMAMENKIAPVVRSTAENRSLPLDSADRDWLLTFVALQSLRTAAAANEVKTSADLFAEAVWRPGVEGRDSGIEEMRIDEHEAVLLSLSSFGDILAGIVDLQVHLVCTPETTPFVTSDNPTYRYNLYCEGIRDRGTVGWAQRGFQIFVPLSPTTLLLLSDASVYKIGSRKSPDVVHASAGDVRTLNRLQFLSADENVYFHAWTLAQHCRDLNLETRRLRDNGGARVLEFIDKEDANHGLLHSFQQMPDLKLQLSFMSIRRSARRVPLFNRPEVLRGLGDDGVRAKTVMRPNDADHHVFVRADSPSNQNFPSRHSPRQR
ncbi:MAG TPA: DUF4238 domain-containing protein [Longimicrobium sp.]|jgi:hypothetical protein|uniref:DUF4238 domain-containing protein n=1 Tax=Longimicrobium sp. TaxID=2029185 RepID=UPI002ED84F52